MAWQDVPMDGLEGLNSFWGQVAPYLFPILLIVFIGSLFVFVVKRVAFAVS